jgi:hypothetical protein
MSINLRKEQNDYIDEILSKGLYEIQNFPSFNSSFISNKINEEEKNNNKENIIKKIPNNKEIIEKALLNTEKNIKKLNKHITGNNLYYSLNNYDNNINSDLSTTTQNLIDKYIDLKSSNNDSLFNEFKDNIFKINYNTENNNKNIIYKKYNPKSSALKLLIKKLKKENEYEESRNNNKSYNSNSIQISSFGDSELFTLGNSNNNIISSKEKKHKKYNSELNSDIIKIKNIRTFDKIMDSKSKKLSSNILNYNSTPDLSLLKSKLYINKYKKKRPKSMIKIKEKDFYIKYNELRDKFILQREKMKNEKENVIILQQKIKLIKKKLEKKLELVDFNKTLNEQNNILIKNLTFSDNIRKRNSELINILQNRIKKIKNKFHK